MKPSIVLLVIVAGLAVVLAFLIWKARYTRTVRRETLQRSLAVTAGKVFEQLVPYLPGFPYNPKDARFLGSPVDFVVFDGLNDGDVKRVVFVEVKTGASELSPRERRVRDAVRNAQVEWLELRLPPSNPPLTSAGEGL